MLHGHKKKCGRSERSGSRTVGEVVAEPNHRSWAGGACANRVGQRRGREYPRAGRTAAGYAKVCLWRRRYASQGLDGLRNRPRAGRPRRITAAKEQAVVSATLRKPRNATHWSARRLAKEVDLSKTAVHRIWQKYGLQPHRVETFKFSREPEFDRKLADLVGLYLDPPERAWVLCVGEKSQIQALNRSQRALPMWPGLPARLTHDYTRHDTTSLFAALEVVSGKVHGRCFKRHTHLEFIAFLESLARRYPKRELHLICDNYGTHKHPAVTQWLAAPVSSCISPDQRFLAQPGRALVRADYRPSHPSRQLRQCRPPGESHHGLAAAMEPKRPASSLD